MYMLIVYSLNEINSWIKVLSRQMSFQELILEPWGILMIAEVEYYCDHQPL